MIKKISVFFIIGIYVAACECSTVDQIFFHEGNLADKLVFYTSHKLNPRTLEKMVAQKKSVAFTLENTELSPSARERAIFINKKFKKEHNRAYTISLQTKTDKKSTCVTIIFDQNKIAISKGCFTSVKGEHGLFFVFHNKPALKTIEEKTDSQMLAAKKIHPTVVIDCGHGGHDPGAQGKHAAIEKDITLAVGRKTRNLLERQGFKVYLTRSVDVFVPLDERTTFANLLVYADAFISIHANSSSNPQIQGIETYYLDPRLLTLDDTSKMPANVISKQRSILSAQLSRKVHSNILEAARKKNPDLPDRGVKTCVSQVLLGAEAPAALVELNFVTHDDAARLLTDDGYQDTQAQGLANGVTAYFNNA